MPVTDADFVQEKTGFNASATSHSVSLDAGTTAGSTVLVVFNSAAVSVTGIPSGFASVGATTQMLAYVKSNVSAGETSFGNWTFSIAGVATWWVKEITNVASVDPYDGHVAPGGSTVSNGGTKSTGTTALNAGSNGAAFAVWGTTKAGATDVNTIGSYTNGFTELIDIAPASGSTGRQLAVAWKPYDALSTYESTATLTSSVASATVASLILLLRSADAAINAPLSYLTTFGWATHAGMGNSSPANPTGGGLSSGTYGTSYSVGAYGRDGRTGAEVVNSVAHDGIGLPTLTSSTMAFGCNVDPVSGSGTPIVAVFAPSAGTALYLLYDVTNEKFGLQWTGGTTVWQTGTSPLAGGHVWVDVRATWNSSTFHADWRIESGTGDGVQTSPADLAGSVQTSIIISPGPVSYNSNQTGTFRYSDIVYSKYAAAYPLGPHEVKVLVPETTGASVSGTSTNFSQFTANGTLSAWASTAGDKIDEIPVTISASSDGVVQTATAASDYMQFPMTTYTLASDEIAAGVRMVVALWSGAGSGAGDLAIRGYDGTTETALATVSQTTPGSTTTASSTYPTWRSAMWPGGTTGAWNQTRLNAAALRIGFSGDATPDMGVSAAYLEVAVRYAPSWVRHRLADPENPDTDGAVVEEWLHPYTSGQRMFRVTNDHATRSCVFTFFESGGQHASSPVTVTAGNTQDITIGADDPTIVSSTFGWT